jgi:hypothetical protein
MVISCARLVPENDCAGEGQQQLYKTDPSSRQRGCYTRAMTASVQWNKKLASREFKRAWRQDKLIGGKPQVVK